MFLADIQRARARLLYDGEQPAEDALPDSETGVVNVTSLAPSAAASDSLLPEMSAVQDKRDESLTLT